MKKIYNEEKTMELIDPDLERGYLYDGTRLVKHHDAVPEKIIKTVDQVKAELEAQGKEVNLRTYENDNGEIEKKYFVVTKVYYRDGVRTGNDEAEVLPVQEEGKEAWDEYEDIQVYHPYTEEEYIEYLRAEREAICFPVINRGAAWYARLTPEQNEELQAWYQAWLDVTETKVKPETPVWI